MARTTKRLLWLFAAMLAISGALAAYVYLVSTNAALERAESFQFRRMQVARVAGDDVFRFFFATNRTPRPADESAGERFTAQRAGQLSFGFFETEIEPTLGLGMWLDAGSWLMEEEIRILRVETLERAALVEQVRGMVAASPHRGLLLLIHGYRTGFDYALRGTAFLAHILDIDAPVMVFDWPGNQGDSLGGYRRAQRVASESGAELAETLRLILREIEPDKLWLVANSLGGQVVVDAMGRLYEDADLGDPDPELDEVVLTAPDVDRASFDERFKRELAALARHTTVYVSSNDRALLVSRVVNRASRLGQSTLSKATAEPVEVDELEEEDEVEEVLELMDPGSDRVSLVDVTPVNRTRNFHNFSLEVPEFFDDIFLRLINSDTPENRLRYRLRTPEGKVYSVLTRGR